MFRHTIAPRLFEKGQDLVTAKEILGHSNISTALPYAHTSADRERRAVGKLGTTDNVT